MFSNQKCKFCKWSDASHLEQAVYKQSSLYAKISWKQQCHFHSKNGGKGKGWGLLMMTHDKLSTPMYESITRKKIIWLNSCYYNLFKNFFKVCKDREIQGCQDKWYFTGGS